VRNRSATDFPPAFSPFSPSVPALLVKAAVARSERKGGREGGRKGGEYKYTRLKEQEQEREIEKERRRRIRL